MPKEVYLLYGTLLALFVAYITAKISARSQLDIAEKNASKELALQENELLSKRLEKEVRLERKRLEELHKILSKIALENSQTMSYIQSDSNLEIAEFRGRYLANCERLHVAEAIVDLYYPEMGDSAKKIYGQTNVFWGYQEHVLRTDINIDKDSYLAYLGKVVSAGDEIAGLGRDLKYMVRCRGEELNKKMRSTS